MAATSVKGLTQAQRNAARARLLEKAREIRENMESSRAGQALGESTTNLEDLPQQSHEEWIFLNRNSIDVSLLREISDAVVRIDEGSYGLCLECDEPVSKKRLDAIPWARLCLQCQEEAAADAEMRQAAVSRR